MLAVEDETLITMMGMLCSLVLNVVLAIVNSRKKQEQSVAEDALKAVTRRLMAEETVPVAEVEKLANSTQTPLEKRVMDRTMNVVITQSLQNKAFGLDE